ncbi:transposase-like protein [Bradyrhizobium yuanmingense]
MIDREHNLPITRQAEVLKISRGSVYYLPRPVPPADLAIMQRLDRLHLEFPFAGSRMLRELLAAEGSKIGRRHVKTLMRRMGIEALYRRPRTTKPEPGHKIYPYLLRGMEITRPNQVWAMDITYIPMARGFVYLAVVLDWATRRVLSWRVSITMEAAFCVETLEDALARHGKPDIFNTDQGSQFTGAAFTGVLDVSKVIQHTVARILGLSEALERPAENPDRATALVKRTPQGDVARPSAEATTGRALEADHERIAAAARTPYFQVFGSAMELQRHQAPFAWSTRGRNASVERNDGSIHGSSRRKIAFPRQAMA